MQICNTGRDERLTKAGMTELCKWAGVDDSSMKVWG